MTLKTHVSRAAHLTSSLMLFALHCTADPETPEDVIPDDPQALVGTWELHVESAVDATSDPAPERWETLTFNEDMTYTYKSKSKVATGTTDTANYEGTWALEADHLHLTHSEVREGTTFKLDQRTSFALVKGRLFLGAVMVRTEGDDASLLGTWQYHHDADERFVDGDGESQTRLLDYDFIMRVTEQKFTFEESWSIYDAAGQQEPDEPTPDFATGQGVVRWDGNKVYLRFADESGPEETDLQLQDTETFIGHLIGNNVLLLGTDTERDPEPFGFQRR